VEEVKVVEKEKKPATEEATPTAEPPASAKATAGKAKQ